jgi:hypothetical protein
MIGVTVWVIKVVFLSINFLSCFGEIDEKVWRRCESLLGANMIPFQVLLYGEVDVDWFN